MHAITSTVMAVSVIKRLSAAALGAAKNTVTGWLLTFPGAGLQDSGHSALVLVVVRGGF